MTPGAARPGAEEPASGLMNIGQVLELLRPHLPPEVLKAVIEL